MASTPNHGLSPRKKLDLSTLGGLSLAVAGIVGGLLLEGGQVGDIAQFTAGLIVLGGTLGAVMITTPLPLLLNGLRKIPSLFWEDERKPEAVSEEIIAFAARARRHGIVSLEQDANAISDPFLRKALSLAVDGTDLEDIRRIMELEITVSEQRGEAEARVFEAAGGYAPTIGIIGAVLGLIQVMKHLEEISAVGHGIAVAFVATVYGVAAANLLFLPAAAKLKLRLEHSVQLKELMLEGVVGIGEGLNPKLIRSKLEAWQGSRPAGEPKKGKARNAALASMTAQNP